MKLMCLDEVPEHCSPTSPVEMHGGQSCERAPLTYSHREGRNSLCDLICVTKINPLAQIKISKEAVLNTAVKETLERRNFQESI